MGVVIPIGLETLAAQIVDIGEFLTLEEAVGAGFTSVGTGAAEYVAGQLTVIEGGAAAEVVTMDSALAAAQAAATQGASLAATQQTTQTASMSLLKTATGYKACAVLSMDVGAVGACCAPLFGAALGYGLWEANPKLWTDLSVKLLPFAYPGTTQIPTFLDIARDAVTGSFTYKLLVKKGIVDAVQEVFLEHDIGTKYVITTYDGKLLHGSTPANPRSDGMPVNWQDGHLVIYGNNTGDAFFGRGDGRVSYGYSPVGPYGPILQAGWFTGGDVCGQYGAPLNSSDPSASGTERLDTPPGVSPWAGAEPATPLEPYPFPVIVPFPSTEPPPADPDTEPLVPITPVIPFPVEPIPLDPDNPPDNWPEEEPWPTVVPFPWTNPDPDGEPWPEVIPFPAPEEPPEEWPNEPDTWPEPYPDEEPWPKQPEEWPDDVPWPEEPPDDWPEEPWPESPDEWPEEVPWPETPPDEWPEEIPWPESPEEWPEEVPWPEEKPDDWPEEWPDKPWPESPDDWPDDVPWPTPWPENWPDDQPWPIPWPEELPYPPPFPGPRPSPDPDQEPDPGEITNPDPEPEIEPWIQPTPNPDINPDPYVQPVPDPDVDPTQDAEPIQPYVPPDPPPEDEPYRPTPDPNPDPDPRPDPDPDPRPDPDPEPPPPDPTPLPDGIVPVPPIPNPPLPFDSSHGLISVYNPTPSELYAFADWLWVTYADATIDKIWNNPFDGIITLFELYCDPTIDGRKNIRSGFLDSHIAADTVSRYTEINCGTLGIPEYYGDYFDYSPYSKAHIYLPFIGIQELNVDDIVGHYVNVTYRIDEYNGSCIAMITVAKVGELNGETYEYSNVMYQFSGSCSVELPLTGGSQASIRAGMMTADAYQQAANISATGQLIGGIASTIGGVLSLNAGSIGGGISQMVGAAGTQAYGQAQALSNMLSGKSTVQKSGQFGASHGALGIKKPFIVVTRPKQIEVNNYNMLYGYPAHKMVTIGTCKGYLRCREVHVLSTTATDEEKSLIESLLKSGVYVTE